MMKLVFAIVQNDDAKSLMRLLTEQEVRVTQISSAGGFLRGNNTTLMIGVEQDRLEETLSIIEGKSQRRKSVTSSFDFSMGVGESLPSQVEVGGAVVFVVDVDQYYRY